MQPACNRNGKLLKNNALFPEKSEIFLLRFVAKELSSHLPVMGTELSATRCAARSSFAPEFNYLNIAPETSECIRHSPGLSETALAFTPSGEALRLNC